MFRLKEIRTEKGMSQQELADKSGVNRGIIIRLESAREYETTTTTLRKLAAALDVPISALFFDPSA